MNNEYAHILLVIVIITVSSTCNFKRARGAPIMTDKYDRLKEYETVPGYFMFNSQDANDCKEELKAYSGELKQEAYDNCLSNAMYRSELREEMYYYWQELAEIRIRKMNKRVLFTEEHRPKNIIVFIGDGLGPTTITTSRNRAGRALNLEGLLHTGTAMTYSATNQVPGCGESATAILTGVKTNSGVLGFDSKVKSGECNEEIMNKSRVSSLGDWAVVTDKYAGFVTNTRITSSTVAAFYARTPDDTWEGSVPKECDLYVEDIKTQLFKRKPGKYFRVMLGGGRNIVGNGKKRRKLLKRPQRVKRKQVKTASELAAVIPEEVKSCGLLGLFSDEDMAYNLQRKEHQPRLVNMTSKAIEILENPNGYVLLVVGGLINSAHEKNYIKILIDETNEFDAAVKWAMDHTKENETLIVVTADHSDGLNMVGYPRRMENILGKVDDGYDILFYGVGPSARDRNTNDSIWFQARSLIHSDKTIRTAQDVLVYARGPGAHYFSGNYDLSYIGQTLRYLMFADALPNTKVKYYAVEKCPVNTINHTILLICAVLMLYV